MSDTTPVLAAVDWGTSRFRLWLLARDGRALAQSRGADGLDAGRARGFENVLRHHLDAVSAPEALPVLICGMAGSRQGWVEAPYVEVPASLNALLDSVVPVPGLERDLRIVPGLAKRNHAAPDVMRGEETQLIGTAPQEGSGPLQVCLPGTHSKWAALQGRRVEDFTTYLTGELYAVLGEHSILRHSLAGFDGKVDAEDPVFTAAARRALGAPERILAELFSIRAAALLEGLPGAAAAARLSGLLIGAEVGVALQGKPAPVTLVASGALAELYAAVLAEAGAEVTHIDAEQAVCAGLMAIFLDREDGRLSKESA